MQAVRAFLSGCGRFVCWAGGWLLVLVARLFLAIGAVFQWIGVCHDRAGRWLFARANRFTRRTRAGGAS